MSDQDDKDSIDFPMRKIQQLSLTDLANQHHIKLSSLSQDRGETLESKGGVYEYQHQPFNSTTNTFRQSTNNKSIASSTSELATKRRLEKETNLQLETMQKQLDNIENKNLELIKIKKKYITEIETKTREVKFLEKQVYEQQNEIQHLKQQLESTVRITQKIAPSSTTSTTSATNKASSTSVSISKLAEELKQTQDTLQVKLKENQYLNNINQDLNMKIKILQDALSFRSEEIGLSGHSDLLTKVAQLKGEVIALKKELTSKITQVETIEKDKESLLKEQTTLQEQITIIQQRLAKSQQDSYRYTNNDIGLLLKTTEQERDLLLEYIQQDMNKNITLTKQIENLENELRLINQKYTLTEKTLQETTVQLQHTTKNHTITEEEYSTLRKEYKELKEHYEEITYQYDSLQKQLSRKQLEDDENMKIQATYYTQLRCKDEELLEKSENIILLKTKLQEYEITIPLLNNDNQQMKTKLQTLEQEISSYKQIIHDIEPKLQYYEPYCQELMKELQEKEKKCKILEQENIQYKHSYDLIIALQQDLDDSEGGGGGGGGGRGAEKKENSSFSSSLPNSPVAGRRSGNNNQLPVRFTLDSPSPKTVKDDNNSATVGDYLSLSQQHSLWIGLPSIRNLHPKLYEKIRILSQDLYKKEIEVQQLTNQLTIIEQDYNQLKQETSEQLTHQTKQNHHYQEKSQQYYQQIIDYEKQVLHHQETTHLLQQIKTILKSYPSPKLLPSSNSTGGVKREDFNKTMTTSFLKALTTGQGNNDDDDAFDHLKDHLLPEYLQQLLLQYTQIAYAYHETMDSLEIITKENEELKQSNSLLMMNKELLDKEYTEMKQYTSSKENQYYIHERQYYQSIEQATELTEKQNHLIISLQSKLDTLYRDRQLQKAQIHALQQREDTLKHRLIHQLEHDYSFLYQEILTLYPTFSSSSISLQELLQLILERLSSYMKTVEGREKASLLSAQKEGDYHSSGASTLKRSTSPISGSLQQGVLNQKFAVISRSQREEGSEPVRQTYPLPTSTVHPVTSSHRTVSTGHSGVGGTASLTNSTSRLGRSSSGISLQGESKGSSQAISTNVQSQLLQERLKKAQQAFASMRESLL